MNQSPTGVGPPGSSDAACPGVSTPHCMATVLLASAALMAVGFAAVILLNRAAGRRKRAGDL